MPMAPSHRHHLLIAASPTNWLLHQLVLPEDVRLDLCDPDRLRAMERERGVMKPSQKVPLQVFFAHSGELQHWKVDCDMMISEFLDAVALDADTIADNVLIMRGTPVPGLHELVVSYNPKLAAYIIDGADPDSYITHNWMRSSHLAESQDGQGSMGQGFPTCA